MKIIDVSIYMQRVLAFDCYDEFEKYCKEHNVIESEEDEMMRLGSSGLAGVIEYETPIRDEEGNEIQADLFLALREKRLDDLSHEALHVAWTILENAGVNVDYEQQEPITYLAQYIFREYCKKFKWKYKF